MAEKKEEKKIRVFTAKNGSELSVMSEVLAANKVLYTVKALKTGAFRLSTVSPIGDVKRAKLVDEFVKAQTQQ